MCLRSVHSSVSVEGVARSTRSVKTNTWTGAPREDTWRRGAGLGDAGGLTGIGPHTLLSRPSGMGIRNEEKNVEHGVLGAPEDAPEDTVPKELLDIPVLDELVDADRLRRASH